MTRVWKLTKDLVCFTETKAHAILLHELFVLLRPFSSHICECDKIIREWFGSIVQAVVLRVIIDEMIFFLSGPKIQVTGSR